MKIRHIINHRRWFLLWMWRFVAVCVTRNRFGPVEAVKEQVPAAVEQQLNNNIDDIDCSTNDGYEVVQNKRLLSEIKTTAPTISAIPSVTPRPSYTNKCYVCGSADFKVDISLNEVFEQGGILVGCRQAQSYGLNQFLSESTCWSVQQRIQELAEQAQITPDTQHCTCIPSTDSDSDGLDNNPSITDTLPPKTLVPSPSSSVDDDEGNDSSPATTTADGGDNEEYVPSIAPVVSPSNTGTTATLPPGATLIPSSQVGDDEGDGDNKEGSPSEPTTPSGGKPTSEEATSPTKPTSSTSDKVDDNDSQTPPTGASPSGIISMATTIAAPKTAIITAVGWSTLISTIIVIISIPKIIL